MGNMRNLIHALTDAGWMGFNAGELRLTEVRLGDGRLDPSRIAAANDLQSPIATYPMVNMDLAFPFGFEKGRDRYATMSQANPEIVSLRDLVKADASYTELGVFGRRRGSVGIHMFVYAYCAAGSMPLFERRADGPPMHGFTFRLFNPPL